MDEGGGGGGSGGVPLLGIALVVDDANKGQRLVFRYPALREPSLGDATSGSAAAGGAYSASASLHANSGSSSSGGGGGGGGGGSGGAARAWAIQRCDAEFHHLSPEVFARLFRPKAPLCGRPFQVTVDRVRYLSYPVLTASATKETAREDVLLFNVVLATARVQAKGPAARERARRQRQQRLAWLRASGGGGQDRNGDEQEDEAEEARRLGPLQEVLDHLTKALLHEERRCRYVSREVGLLLQIREAVYGKDWSPDDAQTMLDLMMERSALANDLRNVFHGLKEAEAEASGSYRGQAAQRGQLLEVAVNGWIRLSLPARWPQEALALEPGVAVGASVGRASGRSSGSRAAIAPESIQPYHTVLLLVDEDTLLARLPQDGSQQLRALVRACNPLKTLGELATATRIALPQLRLLAAHLVHWGHARVVRTITLRSMYALKASAPTQLGSLQAMAFQQRFPPHSFFRVLAAFRAGKTLGDLLEGLAEEAQVQRLAQLVWLLQQDVVEEIDLHAAT